MHFDRYRITVDGVDVPGEQMPVPCLLSRLPANTTAAMKTSSSMSTFAISEGYAGYESELDEHLLNPLHRISTDQDMSCRRDGIASRCSSNSLSMITAPSTEPYRCQNPPCDMYDSMLIVDIYDMIIYCSAGFISRDWHVVTDNRRNS